MMRQQNGAILGLIPARGGSKGMPGKNLRLLGGQPLIAHSIQAAHASRLLTRPIVSTDDRGIATVARRFGGDVPFLRPEDLAKDCTPTLEVMLHAIAETEAHSKEKLDLIVLLQPTAPLRSTEDIDATIEALLRTGADSAFTVSPPRDNPFYAYMLSGERPQRLLQNFAPATRRQDYPDVYVRNGSVYVTRRDVLVEQRSIYGRDSVAHIMPSHRAANIDEEIDLQWAEFLLARQAAFKKQHAA